MSPDISLATPLEPEETVTAVVPAAGVGRRMGAECPKQYLTLGGKAILSHTLERLLGYGRIERVIVALGAGDPYWDSLGFGDRVSVVDGGVERADSVLNALDAVNTRFALVHDAARPCLTARDIDRLLAAAQQQAQGAILGMPVRDTMKRVDSQGRITGTVDRSNLYHALTPQLFPARALGSTIRAALAAGIAVTDEASAMEWAGWQPRLVEGRTDNIKITHPDDLRLAELFMRAQQQ